MRHLVVAVWAKVSTETVIVSQRPPLPDALVRFNVADGADCLRPVRHVKLQVAHVPTPGELARRALYRHRCLRELHLPTGSIPRRCCS